MGWRIENAAEARAEFRRLRREGGPLLVCANHLTMIDSALIAWALFDETFAPTAARTWRECSTVAP